MVQHVITLANSVVGVSVLALPFCFQQCGIVLATLMLVLSAIMTRLVCHFLLKGGIITRRRTYELLAYHTYGPTGKLLCEFTIIVFLLGTLIAFLVVMGDLGPVLVAEVFDIENNHSLRTIVMTGLALFVALPLGLLRNIESLGSVSMITLMFYVVLVCKVLAVGVGPLWGGSCLNHLNYWRPAGILQCIPIFAMAFSCQSQIFPLYDSLPDPSLNKMNSIVKYAVNICTGFYFCVGFFGYVAFCSEPVTGNILVNFKQSWSTQIIKSCFVFSIALSVPLVVLPLRATLHSMIWRNPALSYHHLQDATSTYIPEGRLRLLTVTIIGTTLIVGLLIPNIELVLGLVGSTAGSIICIIFPALMFISVTPKNTTEKLAAKGILVLGICILFLTTYATLYTVEKANVEEYEHIVKTQMRHEKLLDEISPKAVISEASIPDGKGKVPSNVPIIEKEPAKKEEVLPPVNVVEPIEPKVIPKEQVQKVSGEPPILPIAREPEKEALQPKHKEEKLKPPEQVLEEINVQKEQVIPKDTFEEQEKKVNPEKKDQQLVEKVEAMPRAETQGQEGKGKEPKRHKDIGAEQKPKEVVELPEQSPAKEGDASNKVNQEHKVEIDVPKKQEQRAPQPDVREVRDTSGELKHVKVTSPASETKKKSSEVSKTALDNGAAEELLKKLTQQQEEQRKLIEQQKQVLEELKKHQEEHDKEGNLEVKDGEPKNADGGAEVQLPEPVEVKNDVLVPNKPALDKQKSVQISPPQPPSSNLNNFNQQAPIPIERQKAVKQVEAVPEVKPIKTEPVQKPSNDVDL